MLGQSSDIGTVIIASIAIIGACIGGFYVIARLRKKMKEDDYAATPGAGGFTLTDLRELHKSGQMTDEEFDKAKHLIVASMKSQQATAAVKKVEEEGKSRVRGPNQKGAPPRHHHKPPIDD